MGMGRQAWFAGKHEKSADVVIRMSIHSSEAGWASPFVAAAVTDEAGGPVAHWNPVLFVHGGCVTLYFKVGANISRWVQFSMHAPADADLVRQADADSLLCRLLYLVPAHYQDIFAAEALFHGARSTYAHRVA
jgi:predicted neuraminidase